MLYYHCAPNKIVIGIYVYGFNGNVGEQYNTIIRQCNNKIVEVVSTIKLLSLNIKNNFGFNLILGGIFRGLF